MPEMWLTSEPMIFIKMLYGPWAFRQDLCNVG